MSLLEISYAEDLAQNPEQVLSLMSYQAKRRVFFLKQCPQIVPPVPRMLLLFLFLVWGSFKKRQKYGA